VKPCSFDIDTAKELVGDARMRVIESKAREDADKNVIDPPLEGQGSYWSKVSAEMDYRVYINAHGKRLERNKRKASNEPMD
jgi:hypothetical protein